MKKCPPTWSVLLLFLCFGSIIFFFLKHQWCVYISYFPRLAKKKFTLSSFPLFISPTMQHFVLSDLLSIAWSRQCGAISMTIALSGTWCRASWNRTGLTRLFTWYSAEENLARSEDQLDSGIDVLIHRLLRGFLSITWNSMNIPNVKKEWTQTILVAGFLEKMEVASLVFESLQKSGPLYGRNLLSESKFFPLIAAPYLLTEKSSQNRIISLSKRKCFLYC